MRHPIVSPPAALAALAWSALGCSMLVSPGQLAERAWRERMVRAAVAMSIDDRDDATASLREALGDATTAQSTDPDRGTELVAETEETLGRVAGEGGDAVAAEVHYRRALEQRERAWGPDDPRLFPSLAGLGPSLVGCDRVDEARAVHERAVRLLRPTAEPHSKPLADSFTSMADALRKRGLLELAATYYAGSLDVRDFVVGSDRYDVAIVLEHYADVLGALSRAIDARRVRDRADGILRDSDYSDELWKVVRYAGVRLSWPREAFPLRVFIERADPHSDPDAVAAAARRAVLAWQDVLAPGLPAFRFVDDAARAQIVVRWVDDAGKRTWLGQTKQQLAPMRGVAHIEVSTRRLGVEPPLAEIESVVMHEVGHALGILAHSTYEKDLMFPSYRGVHAPSPRDVATLRWLYP